MFNFTNELFEISEINKIRGRILLFSFIVLITYKFDGSKIIQNSDVKIIIAIYEYKYLPYILLLLNNYLLISFILKLASAINSNFYSEKIKYLGDANLSMLLHSTKIKNLTEQAEKIFHRIIDRDAKINEYRNSASNISDESTFLEIAEKLNNLLNNLTTMKSENYELYSYILNQGHINRYNVDLSNHQFEINNKLSNLLTAFKSITQDLNYEMSLSHSLNNIIKEIDKLIFMEKISLRCDFWLLQTLLPISISFYSSFEILNYIYQNR